MGRDLSVAEHRSFVAANVSEGGIAAIRPLQVATPAIAIGWFASDRRAEGRIA